MHKKELEMNFKSEFQTQPNNVYLLQQAASSYKKSAHIPSHVFEEITEYLINLEPDIKSNSHRALDIGIGTGNFTIPIMKNIIDRKMKLHLEGFDISDHMLIELKKEIDAVENLSGLVRYERRDAEDGLPESIYSSNSYALVIITFMLHYLNKWQNLMDDVIRVMAPGGILIQSEVLRGLRPVDGTFDNIDGLDADFVAFWKTYFEYREKFSKWDAEMRVSNLDPVVNYLRNNDGVEFIGSQDFHYENQVSYEDMLLWIQTGVFSSVGSGLNDSQKSQLKDKMKEWLRDENLEPKEKFACKMGVKAWFHKKN